MQSEDEQTRRERDYVLSVAEKLFRMTFPFAKDEKGYTFPDAWLFRNVLVEREELTDQNVEWIRRQLLKYENQVRGLGLDYERLNNTRISGEAVYWRKELADSKLLSVKVSVGEETNITATYRIFQQRKRKNAYANMSRAEGMELLKSLELIPSDVIHAGEATADLEEIKLEFVGDGATQIAERLCLPTAPPRSQRGNPMREEPSGKENPEWIRSAEDNRFIRIKCRRHRWSNGYEDGSHCTVCGQLRCQCWIDNTHASATRLEENCQVHGTKERKPTKVMRMNLLSGDEA